MLSKQDGRVEALGLTAAGPVQRSDLRDGALRGSLLGLLVGVISALFILGGWPVESDALRATTLYALPLTMWFAGAWWGGMLGLMQDNPALKPFLAQRDSGEFIILIESSPVDERLVKRVMAMADAVLIAEQPWSWGRFQVTPLLPSGKGAS
ncbi:hypothetical protein I6N98_10360 [Spongiibacter nanhainus]|uniref:Uncharacterized protein n=1 Tax=Spongiibacter nanhainus TaxID=2794344 RepID=A0A7T4UP89_9GAMM|nr:hypothetical protein [Spongiibacter nanhainus]QQD16793.1 hypothetical protein I6N98_10360 [Spongiibacter nanhainus]